MPAHLVLLDGSQLLDQLNVLNVLPPIVMFVLMSDLTNVQLVPKIITWILPVKLVILVSLHLLDQTEVMTAQLVPITVLLALTLRHVQSVKLVMLCPIKLVKHAVIPIVTLVLLPALANAHLVMLAII